MTHADFAFSGSPTFQFAISATFTAEPIEPVLVFWGRQLGSNFAVRFAPYNQVLQTLLDPHGEFASNQHGINVLLVRLEDLGEFDRLESNVRHLVEGVRGASSHLASPLILCLCPSSPRFLAQPGRPALLRRIEGFLNAGLGDVPGVQLLDSEQIRTLYPVEGWYDADGERLGKIPYTETYFCGLGTALVRLTHALFAPPYKVIVLDCDNTLWQGICGEDGPRGVLLDAPRRALQEFMLAQRDCGMLLCLASKNNEEDVLETFRQNPDMPLRLLHFAAWRINWESKADKLASLAADLGLGLDSFIFVDDNPRECAEVEESLPQVLTLTLPADVTGAPHFLDHVWAFDHPVVTEEDRQRSSYYAQVQEFGRELRRATNLEQFVAGLDLRVSISAVKPETLSRVAQLSQRTNQFNFTTIRRTEAEIQALVEDGRHECFAVDVADRFGNYGLAGVMIGEWGRDELVVDTFLLSCRVLGRGVEHRMLAFLASRAQELGLKFLSVKLERTQKNQPAQQFLESLGSDLRFPASSLCDLRWKPATSAAPPQSVTTMRAPGATPRRFLEFARVALTLSTPAQILEQMRQERRSRMDGASAAGLTEVERQLAAIWAELLEKPSISPADNFFDLGGHSLLAVLLLLRIREVFGIELSIDDIYSGTVTLAGLAARIETLQAGELDPEEYAQLLAEVEGLSDEEARKLLAQEESEGNPN